MNHDDKKPDMQAWIEPELEARVVAWVSGEASAFEAAELERLTAEKPELAIFKRRLEAVRGLVAEALRPDPQPMLLSPERRAKLLKAIGAPEKGAATGAATAAVVQPLVDARRRNRKYRRWIYAIAACLTVGFFTMLSIPEFQRVRSLAYAEKAPAMKMRAEVQMHKMEIESRAQADASTRTEEAEAFARAKTDSDMTVREDELRFSQRRSDLVAQTQANRAYAAPRDANSESVSVEMPSAQYARPNAPVDANSLPTVQAQAPAMTFSYGAANTLAGSRVNTDLKDISSDITVASRQFLNDSAAAGITGQFDVAQLDKGKARQGNLVADNERNWGIDQAAAPQQRGHGMVGGYLSAPLTGSNALGVVVAGAAGPKSANAVSLDGFAAPPSPGSPADEPVTLSPFVVASARDSGYKSATSTGDARIAERDANGSFAKKNETKKEADEPLSPPAKPVPDEDEVVEVNAAKEPVSTFSLHVSDASFRLAQAALARGEEPDADQIRPEEFYNAFNYGDPAPAMAEKVGCRVEQAAHPFVQQRNLVRIAMQVAATGRGAGQPLHLTVLLDTSGSMEREDRADTVHRAMMVLTSLLGPSDRVTLVGFARQPTLLAEDFSGDQAGRLMEIIAATPAEGGTNVEEALKLGGQLARRHFAPAAQNRIVLLTDGAANLGNADPAQLARTVEGLRQQGITFDACGVGRAGIDDTVLEALTRKGGGRYYVLDSPEAADTGFAHQLAGAFRPAAENVKVQVRFNPARVGNYRLIGFEKHRLKEEDFRNDQVRAAELAAEEAAVALYQVEVRPEGEGELGEVYVRFRDVASGAMVERSWTLAYDPRAPALDRASPAMQLTGASALLAEKLRGGAAGDTINLKDLAGVMNKLHGHYAQEKRVQELVAMFNQARKLGGE